MSQWQTVTARQWRDALYGKRGDGGDRVSLKSRLGSRRATSKRRSPPSLTCTAELRALATELHPCIPHARTTEAEARHWATNYVGRDRRTPEDARACDWMVDPLHLEGTFLESQAAIEAGIGAAITGSDCSSSNNSSNSGGSDTRKYQGLSKFDMATTTTTSAGPSAAAVPTSAGYFDDVPVPSHQLPLDSHPWNQGPRTRIATPIVRGQPRWQATVTPANETVYTEYDGVDMTQVYQRQANIQPMLTETVRPSWHDHARTSAHAQKKTRGGLFPNPTTTGDKFSPTSETYPPPPVPRREKIISPVDDRSSSNSATLRSSLRRERLPPGIRSFGPPMRSENLLTEVEIDEAYLDGDFSSFSFINNNNNSNSDIISSSNSSNTMADDVSVVAPAGVMPPSAAAVSAAQMAASGGAAVPPSPHRDALATLRRQERELLELQRVREAERLQGPEPYWYMEKTKKFTREHAINTRIATSRMLARQRVMYGNVLDTIAYGPRVRS